jgi:hypothetical protein
MARVALIIDKIEDAWGDEWDVREYRTTDHAFPVSLGWPHGHPRGRGGGGVRVIVTPQLAHHFEEHRLAPGELALPIGNSTIKRIRRLLGHHRQIDRAAWWEERVSDLTDLTIDEFTQKHSVSAGAVANARHALFGHKLRPAGWWQQKDVADILMGDAPRSDIADLLEISVGSVGRLRWMLQKKPVRPKRRWLADGRPYGWSEEFIAMMKGLINDGLAAVDIGRRMGVPAKQILYASQRGYLPRPARKVRPAAPGMDRAVEIVESGTTYTEAARASGFSITNVSKACRKAGIESTRRSPNMACAVEMVRSGATYSEAARACNLTSAGVGYACRKADVISPRALNIRSTPESDA